MVRLTLNAVQRHTFSKQLATDRHPREVVDVARTLVGLHSARLPSPYVTLAARIDRFAPQSLRDVVYHRRHAIKLRCMRRTLHIVPVDLAPVVHAATVHFRVQDKQRVLWNLGVSRRTISHAREAVTALVTDGPRAPREIEEVLASARPGSTTSAAWAHLLRAITKLLWEEGVLCYLNESPTWLSEQRRFGLTAKIYPSVQLNDLDASQATMELVYRHIETYGPVAEEDVAWWSGLSMTAIRLSVERCGKRVVRVDVPGIGENLLVTTRNLEELAAECGAGEPWLRLLAYEDSSLKGYFATRHRYVDAKFYDALFNSIGEVRPSIVYNGRAIGTWQWDRRTRRVIYTLFEAVSRSVTRLLAAEVARVESCFVHD